MQTYTHLLVAGVAASIAFPGQPITQTTFIAGSIAPDLVLVPAFVCDKIRGIQPLTQMGKTTLTLTEVSHSLPLVTVALISIIVIGLQTTNELTQSILRDLYFFFTGVFIHIAIDVFTHCDPKFAATDQSCVWPLSPPLPKLGQVLGIWDYRYDFGVLKPKPFESIVCLLAIIVWIHRLTH